MRELHTAATRTEICGIGIDVRTGEEHLRDLVACIRSGEKGLYLYVNAHGVNLAVADPRMSALYRTARAVYADGQGVRFGVRMLQRPVPPHLPLTTWVWDILTLCEREKYSVYLLGGREEMLARAVRAITARHTDIRIAGTHDGYFRSSPGGTQRVLESIAAAAPDILFVGLGMPVQERWISEHLREIRANAIFTCGSCLEVIAGERLAAPRWVQTAGLEWMVRLAQEPRRLLGRYLVGNPKFILNVMAEIVRNHNHQAPV